MHICGYAYISLTCVAVLTKGQTWTLVTAGSLSDLSHIMLPTILVAVLRAVMKKVMDHVWDPLIML